MDRHVINMIAKKAADECVKSAFDLNSIIEHIKGMFGGGNIDIKDIMPYLGAAMPLFKGVGGLAGLPGVAGLLDLARGGANMRTLTAGAGVQAAPSNGAQPPTPPPPQTATAIPNAPAPPVATTPPPVNNVAAATPLPGQPDPYPGEGASWSAINAWQGTQPANKPAPVASAPKQNSLQTAWSEWQGTQPANKPAPVASAPQQRQTPYAMDVKSPTGGPGGAWAGGITSGRGNVPAPAQQTKAQLPKAGFFDFMSSSGPKPGASPPGSPGPSALRIKPPVPPKPLGT